MISPSTPSKGLQLLLCLRLTSTIHIHCSISIYTRFSKFGGLCVAIFVAYETTIWDWSYTWFIFWNTELYNELYMLMRINKKIAISHHLHVKCIRSCRWTEIFANALYDKSFLDHSANAFHWRLRTKWQQKWIANHLNCEWKYRYNHCLVLTIGQLYFSSLALLLSIKGL